VITTPSSSQTSTQEVIVTSSSTSFTETGKCLIDYY
jgi:hypothetical protein